MSSPDAPLLFDDIRVGTVLSTERTYEITREEIIEVAARWDPQPFHMEDEAGARSHFGGLVASGLHTLAASMRLSYDERPRTAAVAGLGFDGLRMHHPVRPGDHLRQTTEIVDVRPSATRPDRGIVQARRMVHNQDGVPVMTYVLTWMVERAT